MNAHRARDAYVAKMRAQVHDASPCARRIDWYARVKAAMSEGGISMRHLIRQTGRDERDYHERLKNGLAMSADVLVSYIEAGLPASVLIPESVVTPDVCRIADAMFHQMSERELATMGDFVDRLWGLPQLDIDPERFPVDQKGKQKKAPRKGP